jgi:hypothetical protein
MDSFFNFNIFQLFNKIIHSCFVFFLYFSFSLFFNLKFIQKISQFDLSIFIIQIFFIFIFPLIFTFFNHCLIIFLFFFCITRSFDFYKFSSLYIFFLCLLGRLFSSILFLLLLELFNCCFISV